MPRRGKAVDIAHISSLSRFSSRLGGVSTTSRFTISERPRTPRSNFTRFTRHGQRHLKPQQTDFQIRTSVADLVIKELDAFERCIFYQRVFILTKNVILTVSSESSVESILEKYMQSKSSSNIDYGLAEEQVEEEAEMSEMGIDEVSQVAPKTDAEAATAELQAKTSREGPLLKLTKAELDATYKEKRLQEVDFFDQFREKVEIIIKKCESEQLSEDRFTGMLLCMGNSHTLLVLEGPEDTISFFCKELLHISKEFFEIMRVFLVEDRIEETYFDEFLYRRAAAMNINEKFPPPTANDPQLMGSQHWLIKDKLRIVCQTLSEELRPKVEPVLLAAPVQSTLHIIEEEKKPPKRRLKPKRKKSPKRAKSPQTQVAVVAQAEARTSNATIHSQVLEGMASMHSAAAVSLTTRSVEKMDSDSPEPFETDLSSPPPLPTEDTVKSEDIPPSSVKVADAPTIMGEEPLIAEELEEEILPKEYLNPFALKPTIYNRLLPEVQRIDLVLTSKRFYINVEEFVRFSQEIPVQQDEDAMIWPTSYSYLPLNVFERLPFDVNLTFGNYDLKETEEGTSSSDEEEKEGDEEGEKKEGEKKEA